MIKSAKRIALKNGAQGLLRWISEKWAALDTAKKVLNISSCIGLKKWSNVEGLAIRRVIEERQSLTEETLLGTALEFTFGENYIHPQPRVHVYDIVPSTRRKQLASGLLSESKMPVGQLNELYQDYVSSVALKMAGDLCHILRLSDVYVTCIGHMLDP